MEVVGMEAVATVAVTRLESWRRWLEGVMEVVVTGIMEEGVQLRRWVGLELLLGLPGASLLEGRMAIAVDTVGMAKAIRPTAMAMEDIRLMVIMIATVAMENTSRAWAERV